MSHADQPSYPYEEIASKWEDYRGIYSHYLVNRAIAVLRIASILEPRFPVGPDCRVLAHLEDSYTSAKGLGQLYRLDHLQKNKTRICGYVWVQKLDCWFYFDKPQIDSNWFPEPTAQGTFRTRDLGFAMSPLGLILEPEDISKLETTLGKDF